MSWSRPRTSEINSAPKVARRHTKAAREIAVEGDLFSVCDNPPEGLPVASNELDLYYHQFRDFLETDGKLWFTRLGNPGGCSPSGQTEIDSIAPFPPYAIRRYLSPSFSPDIDATLGKPQKIIAGPDGYMWFNISPYIGSISPATLEVVLYPVPGSTGNSADINAGPTTDPHATWFAPVVNGRSALGRVSTEDPNTVSVFPLTISGGINSVVAGPDGNIWFTEARTGYAIGRFEVAPPHRMTELPLPDDT